MHATGTRKIEYLGGLVKSMPWTAATFLVGAAAISGLPPLNGFVSEFLIYAGAFGSLGASGLGTACAVVIVGLGLIGGLAAACFTKAFGIIFLGEPRSEHALHGHEASWLMRLPMLLLAGGCVAVGLLGPSAVGLTNRAVEVVTGFSPSEVQSHMTTVMSPLTSVVWIAGLFILLIVLLARVRKWVLSRRVVVESCTWDCGYARPTARMQYTASSFSQPLTRMFEVFLRPRRIGQKPVGLFPAATALGNEMEDLFRHNFYRPIFRGFDWCVSKLRFLQEGHVQLYVLYIALTLLILLIWNLR
jgi:NADH:ubiquinone oxidoreductase subunit 5 (subunit L)/multisubunit Na+/H+ antiporter MnhA subunit